MTKKGQWMRYLVIVVVALIAALAGCRENLPAKLEPGATVAVRGEITAGPECPMLVVEPERRFSLSGDLGRFKIGDRVCIHGTVAEMSICMAGEATINVTAIAPEDSCR
jgi:Protein of unknown function (DUF5818)